LGRQRWGRQARGEAIEGLIDQQLSLIRRSEGLRLKEKRRAAERVPVRKGKGAAKAGPAKREVRREVRSLGLLRQAGGDLGLGGAGGGEISSA
jgi:hypothetical protein